MYILDDAGGEVPFERGEYGQYLKNLKQGRADARSLEPTAQHQTAAG